MTVAAAPELIRQIVEEDHRLEGAAQAATLELMRHRWHWTLDESNPKPPRLTLSDYAQRVGRSPHQIAKCAKGYIIYQERQDALARGDSVHTVTPTDAYELANLSEARRAATEAVAEYHRRKKDGQSISIVNARQHHGEEIRAIRALALERAEKNHSSELEEIPGAAEEFYRAPQAAKEATPQRLEAERRRQEAERKRLEEQRQQQEAEAERLRTEQAQLRAEREAERLRREAEEEAERQRAEIERRHQEAERRHQEAARLRHSERFFEIVGLLGRMRELGKKALEAAEGVAFDAEERDMLAGELNDVRRLVDTMDHAIVGQRAPNWGDEVTVLEGGRR